MWPDGVSNSGFHFLAGYMISVRDTEEFAETSDLQCLYPSFNVRCYGFVSHKNKNMDTARECISLTLEVMVMFLSFQMTLFGHCSCVLGNPGEYFGLGSLIRYYISQIFKATYSLQFLLSMVMSVLMPLVLFVISWVSSTRICMPYAVEASSR